MRLIFAFCVLFALLVGCSGGSNDWTWYDAEYVDASVIEEITCVAGLQGNHYGWYDPQPDHGNDTGKHKCERHGCHDTDEVNDVACDVETFELPAYFVLRNCNLPTLYVDAESLMSLRTELTEDGGLVAIHVADELVVYPDYLFVDDRLDLSLYLEWLELGLGSGK